jgi:hypothetical protein
VVRRNFFCRSGDTQKKNYDHLVVRDPKKVGNPWLRAFRSNFICSVTKCSFTHYTKVIFTKFQSTLIKRYVPVSFYFKLLTYLDLTMGNHTFKNWMCDMQPSHWWVNFMLTYRATINMVCMMLNVIRGNVIKWLMQCFSALVLRNPEVPPK